MLYDTMEKLKKRGQEIDNENISSLKRKASAGNFQFSQLETKYGLDGDYSPKDWGMDQEKADREADQYMLDKIMEK